MNDIPPNLLDSPVSDQDIAKIASHLMKWDKLSPVLGLTPQQETEIRETFHDYDIQKKQVLLKWKQIKGNKATYKALITAASSVFDMRLVNDITAVVQERSRGNSSTIPWSLGSRALNWPRNIV